MAASSETATTRRRRRRDKVASSHVAAPGQRERVAQPVTRPRPTAGEAPVPAPRRSKARGKSQRAAPPPETMIQSRSDQFDLVLSARMLSAVILFSLLVVLFLFFQADTFYVSHVEVGGLRHLTAEEVFALSGIANMHLFWVDPADVEAAIRRSSSVGAVEVSVGWPPHLVQIQVQEREPALIWEQAGVRTWIDVRGRVMPQRTDLEGLIRVVVEGVDDPVGANVIIPQEVVDGALQLRRLYPNIEALLYRPVEGLGFRDVGGWLVWFGTGTDMAAKMNMYNALAADLQARGIYPEFIDVGNVDAPYYKVWWGRDEATEAVPTGETE